MSADTRSFKLGQRVLVLGASGDFQLCVRCPDDVSKKELVPKRTVQPLPCHCTIRWSFQPKGSDVYLDSGTRVKALGLIQGKDPVLVELVDTGIQITVESDALEVMSGRMLRSELSPSFPLAV